MGDLTRGLYEILLTDRLREQLNALDPSLHAQESDLRPAEAGDRIALHLARVIERAISRISDEQRVEEGIRLARELIALIGETNADITDDAPTSDAQVLRAVLGRRLDGQADKLDPPLIPLLDTTLLTNAPGEPRVGNQLVTEIHSADQIDVVMAFVRTSGIRPFLDHLRRHIDSGRSIRLLTPTYTGSTEGTALDLLASAGVAVRVSYDESATRLHAKAWLFHRTSGFSTAYIGSSNLTRSAQVTGLEWNVRVSGARNPDVIAKVAAVFESYWESGDFVDFDRGQFDERTERARALPTVMLSPIELRPEPFQDRLLEQIDLSRQHGHHRNLLAAATGTGKTVMAALDYCRLQQRLPRSRLLFVAHRAEILSQSLATFRYALRDAAFGELWVGSARPRQFEHVFASIQSLTASGVSNLPPEHFDVLIIDEFHHAAAATYEALLERLHPIELLGLTATPERSDGLSVLQWFDNRISAELRLWDAIDQHRLAPFVYYGIHDGLDLRQIPWRRGHGYDVESLTNLYTADDAWARFVIAQLVTRVDDVRRIRALGFCVSVSHARFMARVFNAAGIQSVAVWADSPPEDRRQALVDLAAGRVSVVFSVDLFNEGVDVPVVDTLLLLRPTDSPTLFLQQLGRGLRLAPEKDVCTVLDFVGHHRKEFRFDRRFRALLGGSRQDLVGQIERGFPYLPAGCHMELDAVAADAVLANIRASVPNRWSQKVEELRQLRQGGHAVRLATYLRDTGLELEDVYAGRKTWSDLCEEAGVPILPSGPDETSIRRGVGRLLHVDDTVRLDFW
ncbi:MAG: DEAD/DEAH box helicase family protein, partial [Acidimicrobiales bacterium]